jgi:hypothetical protein
MLQFQLYFILINKENGKLRGAHSGLLFVWIKIAVFDVQNQGF